MSVEDANTAEAQPTALAHILAINGTSASYLPSHPGADNVS